VSDILQKRSKKFLDNLTREKYFVRLCHFY